MPEPEVEVQRLAFDEEIRVAIVGAGGYGRVALDVLLAGGLGDRVLGFYDDAHAAISERVRGYPVLGDIEMLKSMLSVEPVHVVVAITDNTARLRVANSLRGLGGTVLHGHSSAGLRLGRRHDRGRLRRRGGGGRASRYGCGEPLFLGIRVRGGQGRGGGGWELDLRWRGRRFGGPSRGESGPRSQLQRRTQSLCGGRRGGGGAQARRQGGRLIARSIHAFPFGGTEHRSSRSPGLA